MHSDIWHKFQVHLSLDDYGTDCAIISKKQTTFFNTKSGFAKLEFTRFKNVQSLINQIRSIVNHSRSFQYTRCGYELFGFKIKILHFNPLVTLSGLVKTKKHL